LLLFDIKVAVFQFDVKGSSTSAIEDDDKQYSKLKGDTGLGLRVGVFIATSKIWGKGYGAKSSIHIHILSF
jgi:hypothetical protein